MGFLGTIGLDKNDLDKNLSPCFASITAHGVKARWIDLRLLFEHQRITFILHTQKF